MSGDGQLAAIRARHQNWLRQRQSEMERESVVTELQGSGGESAPLQRQQQTQQAQQEQPQPRQQQHQQHGQQVRGGWSLGGDNPGNAVRAEEVLDRLTERLTDRLRVELRAELQAERCTVAAAEEASAARIDASLASEVASHTCPICYELMAPPAGPVLLFPCGHTFCDACIKKHTAGSRASKCPYCRAPIQSQARNVALEQIITSYSSRRHAVPVQSVAPLPPPAIPLPPQPQTRLGAGEDAQAYLRQLRTVSMRCRILANELDDTREASARLLERRAAAAAVLGHLQTEAGSLEVHIAQCCAELEAVRAQVLEQERKREGLEAEAEAHTARASLIEATLLPLEGERAKLRLLVENADCGQQLLCGGAAGDEKLFVGS